MLIEPHEDVCRLCFAAEIPVFRNSGQPNQVDPETGLMYIQEISWEDLSQNGFSLQRRLLYSLAQALAEADRRDAAKSQQKGHAVGYRLAGTLVARVEAINQIADNGQQVFEVLATPLPDQPAHAEIRIAQGLGKDVFLKFRISLRNALGTMQDARVLDDA